ncbi:MAG: hypothetical protein ABGZ35_15480 [Planctomycetaceae bacterium]|jgi:hypothetical protein
MSQHTIRLAGPWERHSAGAELVRVSLPFQIPGVGSSCDLIRRFHRPTGLTETCEVLIILTVDTTSLDVRLNNQLVSVLDSRHSASGIEVSFNVTPQLESFNSLSIRNTETSGVTVQSAVLQIHESP